MSDNTQRNSKIELSLFESYKACFYFLDHHWRQDKATFKDDLPSLLGGMSILWSGNISADPAIIADWYQLIQTDIVTPEQGFNLVKSFLQIKYYHNDETNIILQHMQTPDTALWQLWMQCIAKSQTDDDSYKLKLNKR